MHLTFSLDIGGLENLVLNLFKTLDHDRYRLTVCSLTDKTALAGEFEQQGVHVYRLNKRNGIDPFLPFQLARLIKANQVHILHTHNTAPFFYGFLAGKISGRGNIHVHTEHSRMDPNHRLLGNLLLFFSKRIHKIISDSNAVTDYLIHTQGISREHIVTIFNGIDISLYSSSVPDRGLLDEAGIEAGSKIIGTVGRLEDVKDHATLLLAFAKICQTIANAYLIIVGDGSLRGALTQRAKDLHILERIVFLGSRRDVHRILPLFDLFVLSSKSEGLPLSLLEAMAASVPVIATRVGGIPEIILDHESGLLFSPGDADALADCIHALLLNSEKAKSFSEKAFERVVSSFSMRAMTDQYEAVYNSLVK